MLQLVGVIKLTGGGLHAVVLDYVYKTEKKIRALNSWGSKKTTLFMDKTNFVYSVFINPLIVAKKNCKGKMCVPQLPSLAYKEAIQGFEEFHKDNARIVELRKREAELKARETKLRELEKYLKQSQINNKQNNKNSATNEINKNLNAKYLKDFPNGTPFIIACGQGNLEDVKMFIKSGMVNDVNMVGKSSYRFNDFTPLGRASEKEQHHVVEYLLSLPNIDVGAVDSSLGHTAIHKAAQYNKKNLRVLKLLLNHKTCTIAVLNKTDISGVTALDGCFYNHSSTKDDIVKMLKSKGGKTRAELNLEKQARAKILGLNAKYLKEFPRGTPFIIACQKGRLEDVKTFVTSGTIKNVNMVGKTGEDWRKACHL